MSDPTVVCAWCKAVLSAGSDPASHGVCARCLQQHLGLAEEMVEAAERTRMRGVADVTSDSDPRKRSA